MVQDGPKTSFFKKTINFCSERPFTAVLTYILIVSAIFLIFPGLDVRASNFFYNGEGSFPVSKDPFWRSVRYFGVYLFQWVAGLSLLVMLIKLAFPKIKALMDLRHPIFVVSTLILGPGLVVNAFFKNLWGRPRPRQTDIFGGDLPFIGVWQPTNHCDSNCSFVSGEASASIWLFTLVFIAPKAWRIPLATAIGALVFVLSANRVAFGGHYFSDTLLSWGITMLVIIGVYHYLYQRTPNWAQPNNLETSFTNGGNWLRTKIGSAACWCARGTKSFFRKFK
ncbi:Membrane-associated enzyme, PAP2 (acid phosphatase) superfamily [Pseudovibrio denitrificans]|uniref:Membrane-associated enzyme, PAP2 (Acid phosphatase) superfamily n=1 Tax=Pseudovibrio denitrificans TaxID=258256 RepID=A0A1I7AM71_9HYPH|nr:phosphatase PAP2 family protein [Pseudovibrio denitrificans]SFT75966.1 Membrane-associated enzyme, PAP2 (acid phosphatase) superfamily [Pseudovibrio denitrificans]